MPAHEEQEETEPMEDDRVGELAEWLRESLSKLDQDDGGTIVIFKGEVGNKANQVTQLDTSDLDAKSLDQLAQAIYDTSASDAMNSGGGIYFITVEGTSGRFPLDFREPGESTNEGNAMVRHGGDGMTRHGGDNYGGPRDPRNPFHRMVLEPWVEFSRSQNRHFETLFEATIRERADMHKALVKTIAEQGETIRSLEKERAKERLLMEELQSAKHLRDLELERLRKEEERKDEALGLVKPWAHGIAARFLGPKAVPKDVVPLLQQFEAVFSTFTPEQFNAITSTGNIQLTPRQVQELVGVFSTIHNLTDQAKKSAAEHQANHQTQS